MTTGYVDTNILIDYFAGHPSAKTTLEKFTHLKLPAVNYAEFMAGVHSERQRIVADKVINAIFEVVHTDMNICREAAALRREMRLKMPDALAYATARTGKGTFITRDKKDFTIGIDDIYVPYT